MAKVKTSDWHSHDSANRGGWLTLFGHGEVTNRYWTGAFYHPLGIVEVYRQADHTRLSFGHQGRVYHRSWEAYWGDRTINQLARQFVSDVLEGEV